MFRVDINAL